ncbi:DUF484 family protein [Cupriavidus gilardii]|uniref:DUF484 family protein n=1 Tax=Cupriavidus gilardii TaxID=82541 RepID=UPI001EE5ADE4|nr:DUF484 family protein [Cupriavidus gilardii]MCG5259351.1 DUF484 family protein [Cupriavidus gilardii]MDF9431043.1 DUF484 family protein [Cupriavidus gilardii]
MNPQDVAAYLQSHPQFFEDHAELLASVQLTSPHSHRAVSLQQRQMEILREKNKGLELKLANLMRHGHDNDRTQNRMHAWQLRLLGEADALALPMAVSQGLQQVFDVPAVALRLWQLAETHAPLDLLRGDQTAATEAARRFAEGLQTPYCGANPWAIEPTVAEDGAPPAPLAGAAAADSLGEGGKQAVDWLERDDIASLAMVALRAPAGEDAEAGPTFGLLVLGSPDPRRFHEGMGTAYLSRIGELAGAALARLRG